MNAVNGYAHLVLNGWIKRNGLNISIIPYSGVSKAIPDLLGGHLDGVVDVVGGTIGFVKDGKLRALSILQSKPSSIANGTLPFGGNAVQDLSVTTSFVLLTKTGTPPEVIERIYQGVKDVMMQTESQSRLDELALELVLSSPARTAEFITSENARFKDIIARSNLSKTSESNMSDNLSSASVTVSPPSPRLGERHPRDSQGDSQPDAAALLRDRLGHRTGRRDLECPGLSP